ncbi:MAG: ATP synthase F0 subunit B [Deltaproteobacteria bacterium]|nr:ATP synthase F0 subunit B [Deltaproteobacteria bacterium]
MDAFTQIATQLGIDHTFYILFVMVGVLYLLLTPLYLKPYQRILHDRKEKTEGARKEAEGLKAQAEETFSNYKARLKEVNDKARATLREKEESAKKEEAKILAEAANKAKTALQNTQKELDSQRKVTLDALAGEITGIAEEIATKAMGRPITTR